MAKNYKETYEKERQRCIDNMHALTYGAYTIEELLSSAFKSGWGAASNLCLQVAKETVVEEQKGLEG
jgi:hypothetical protein